MNIIKLETVDSTNSYLKKMANTQENLPNFLTVWTPKQTNGVGQYAAKWEVEPYKNLTFSVLCKYSDFDLQNYFLLNMLTSIAVTKSLEALEISGISIKWPNDILISKRKVGGILIENIIRKAKIDKSIIGIGLNVNQLNFNNLPKASSLKNCTGKEYDIESLMKQILMNLKKYFNDIQCINFEDVYLEYEKYLFQLNKVSAFRAGNRNSFSGIIRKVRSSGELVVEIEDGTFKVFSLKEVEMLY